MDCTLDRLPVTHRAQIETETRFHSQWHHHWVGTESTKVRQAYQSTISDMFWNLIFQIVIDPNRNFFNPHRRWRHKTALEVRQSGLDMNLSGFNLGITTRKIIYFFFLCSACLFRTFRLDQNNKFKRCLGAQSGSRDQKKSLFWMIWNINHRTSEEVRYQVKQSKGVCNTAAGRSTHGTGKGHESQPRYTLARDHLANTSIIRNMSSLFSCP